MTAGNETWFTSDHHFGHRNIIDHAGRPFATVEAMDNYMVNAWNSCVAPADDVYYLGDFALAKDPAGYFHRLNGRKHLVRGNHDGPKVLRLPWSSQSDIKRVKVHTEGESHRFVLCHYPMETWQDAHHGAIHLHGHSHGTMNRRGPHDRNGPRFDVGVDAVDGWRWSDPLLLFSPISATEIVRIIKHTGLAYDPVDHHGRTER